MKSMNASREVMIALTAIYGNKTKLIIIADIEYCEFDRYGTKVDFTLVSGEKIIGRVSRKMHKFTGKIITKNNEVRNLRSYRA